MIPIKTKRKRLNHKRSVKPNV